MSLLQRYNGVPPLRPPPLIINDVQEYEIERIIAHRTNHMRGKEFLVRWKGYAPTSDKWKSEEDLENA